MGKPNAKLWFKVSRTKEGLPEYVICAPTGDKVAALLGCSAKHYNIKALTWTELSELTGCVIPVAMNKDGIAAGDLMFNHNGQFFIMKFV